MAKRFTAIVVLVAAMVLGTTALMMGAGSEGQGAERVVRTFALEPGQEIRIVAWNGPITFETWDRDVVEIEARTEPTGIARWLWRLLAGEATVRFTEDERGVRAEVEATRGMLGRASLAIAFHVRVPREWTGTVSLTTSNGRIQAAGLAGQATLRTSNGAISVRGATGVLDARTSNGTIHVADVNGQLTAVTSNGAVQVLSGTLSGTGRVQTSNGAVELHTGLAPAASYDVTTSNGSVTARLVSPNVALDLTTFNGDIRLETEVTVSAVDSRRLVGRIGAADALLKIRTTNGSIVLGTL